MSEGHGPTRRSPSGAPDESGGAGGGGSGDGGVPPANPTLFVARLSDPRERASVPREVPRGRAAKRAETTSDVTRFRGLVAAGVVGAAAALAAALWLGPSAGRASSRALSRPHTLAKLDCAACHAPAGQRGAAKAAAQGAAEPASTSAMPLIPGVCVGCHGAHASQRPVHARLAREGRLGCPSCHGIHTADQGVTFAVGSPAVRYAPGFEAPAPDVGFHPARKTTVPLVTAGSCSGCHAVGAPTDPIARCLVPGQEALGAARPIVCFDEHQETLPEDGAVRGGREGERERDRDRERERERDRDRERERRPSGGVCSEQHGTDRAIAWEAARAVATAMPAVTAGVSSRAPLQWIGVGLGAAALVFAAFRVGQRLVRRQRAAALPEPVAQPMTRKRLPQIDTTTCIGCYACVDACPYDVLEIERYVAVVARPDACCGLTLCEQRCPNGSLRITDGEPIGERPRVSDALECLDVPGVFLAGDVTGLPLIKNAIRQGDRCATHVAASIAAAPPRRSGEVDVVIVGAGPAGIAAALRAKELGLTMEIIEQGSVAQSIRSFPRGKLVFDQPLEIPVVGKLWLEESTKEDLLVQWLRIVRQEQLPIREDTRMTAVARSGPGFVVTTEPRDGGAPRTIAARRVVLAIGQRGQPRRLPFALRPEVESRVHYHLADARSFEGRRVVVVGLGDVAMEAAIALSRQPGTNVTVVHRGTGFSRGKTRNIEEVKRLEHSGRIGLLFGTVVRDVTPDHVLVEGPSGGRTLVCDAVLVLIGNIPPWSTLRAIGVRTEVDRPEDRSTRISVEGEDQGRPADPSGNRPGPSP